MFIPFSMFIPPPSTFIPFSALYAAFPPPPKKNAGTIAICSTSPLPVYYAKYCPQHLHFHLPRYHESLTSLYFFSLSLLAYSPLTVFSARSSQNTKLLHPKMPTTTFQ
jgi:hypothetical protein